MAVVGVTFRSMEARRYQDPPQGQPVRVDHNSNLQSVVEAPDDRLRIEFAFTTSYGPLGMVKLEGSVLYHHEDVAGALAAWNKDRNLPQQHAQQVHSAILGACIPQTVMLAKDLRLPPPIPIPQVRFGDKGTQGTAATSTPHEGPDAA